MFERSFIGKALTNILSVSFSFIIFELAQVVKSLRVDQNPLSIDFVPIEGTLIVRSIRY